MSLRSLFQPNRKSSDERSHPVHDEPETKNKISLIAATSIYTKIKLFIPDERIKFIAAHLSTINKQLNKIKTDIDHFSANKGKKSLYPDGSIGNTINILAKTSELAKSMIDKMTADDKDYKLILNDLDRILDMVPLLIDSYLKSDLAEFLSNEKKSLDTWQDTLANKLTEKLEKELNPYIEKLKLPLENIFDISINKESFSGIKLLPRDYQKIAYAAIIEAIPKPFQKIMYAAIIECNQILSAIICRLDKIEIRNGYEEGKLLDYISTYQLKFNKNSPLSFLLIHNKSLKDICEQLALMYPDSPCDIYPFSRSKYHSRAQLLSKIKANEFNLDSTYQNRQLMLALDTAIRKITQIREEDIKNKDAMQQLLLVILAHKQMGMNTNITLLLSELDNKNKELYKNSKQKYVDEIIEFFEKENTSHQERHDKTEALMLKIATMLESDKKKFAATKADEASKIDMLQPFIDAKAKVMELYQTHIDPIIHYIQQVNHDAQHALDDLVDEINLIIQQESFQSGPSWIKPKHNKQELVRQLQQTVKDLRAVAPKFMDLSNASRPKVFEEAGVDLLFDQLKIAANYFSTLSRLSNTLPTTLSILNRIGRDKLFDIITITLSCSKKLYLFLDDTEALFHLKKGLLTTKAFKELGDQTVLSSIKKIEEVARKMGYPIEQRNLSPYYNDAYEKGIVNLNNPERKNDFLELRVKKQKAELDLHNQQIKNSHNNNTRHLYAINKIDARINELRSEIQKSWFFTGTANNKLKLLSALKIEFENGRSVSDALKNIKTNSFLVQHDHLLFKGRTGILMKNIITTLKPVSELTKEVQKEIDYLLRQKRKNTLLIRLFDRQHATRFDARIFALQELKASVLSRDVVISADSKLILQEHEKALMAEIATWAAAQREHRKLRQ